VWSLLAFSIEHTALWLPQPTHDGPMGLLPQHEQWLGLCARGLGYDVAHVVCTAVVRKRLARFAVPSVVLWWSAMVNRHD
jgi:hypothetical protein